MMQRTQQLVIHCLPITELFPCFNVKSSSLVRRAGSSNAVILPWHQLLREQRPREDLRELRFALVCFQVILSMIMMRRTKQTKIEGRPIIDLPARVVGLSQADFTSEERQFYDTLERESRQKFNAFRSAGTLNKNYVNILWMLLRLRQVSCVRRDHCKVSNLAALSVKPRLGDASSKKDGIATPIL
jgi:SNF2 family DNA or RNA helicase